MSKRNWFAELIDSIRHEVVEKPWFGREVTPNVEPSPADSGSRVSFADWFSGDPFPIAPHPDVGRGRDPNSDRAPDPGDHDHGIDR